MGGITAAFASFIFSVFYIVKKHTDIAIYLSKKCEVLKKGAR
jgi:hypothetical protein